MYFSRIRIKPDVRDLHMLISGNGYGAHQMLWKLFPGGSDGRMFLFREEIGREQMPFHKGVKGEPVFYTVSESKPLADHPIFAVDSKPYAPQLEEGDRLAFRLRANPVQSAKKERTVEELAIWHKSREAQGLTPTKSIERGRTEKIIRHDVVMDAQHHLLSGLAAESGILVFGKKSDMKKELLTSWRKSSNIQGIEEILKRIIAENERYSKVETGRLNTVKLLDMALKAQINKALEKWLSAKGKNSGFVVVRDSKTERLKFQAEGYQWHALPKKGKSAGFSSVDFEGEIEVIDAAQFSKALFYGIGPAKGFGCGLMLVRRT